MIKVVNTKIKDLKIIKTKVYNDNRGYFSESFNFNQFKQKIGNIQFIQDNESYSKRGVLRGLHYQKKPHEQSKLVRVIKGEIQDVVVDLRKKSQTYLNYQSFILNDKNKNQLFVPKGFAHGFCTLENNTLISYKVDQIYNKENESGVLWNDPDLEIVWPEYNEYIISDKDKLLPKFKDVKNYF